MLFPPLYKRSTEVLRNENDFYIDIYQSFHSFQEKRWQTDWPVIFCGVLIYLLSFGNEYHSHLSLYSFGIYPNWILLLKIENTVPNGPFVQYPSRWECKKFPRRNHGFSRELYPILYYIGTLKNVQFLDVSLQHLETVYRRLPIYNKAVNKSEFSWRREIKNFLRQNHELLPWYGSGALTQYIQIFHQIFCNI